MMRYHRRADQERHRDRRSRSLWRLPRCALCQRPLRGQQWRVSAELCRCCMRQVERQDRGGAG